MFEVLHALVWLITRRERKAAKQRTRFFASLFAHIHPQFEVSLDEEDEERVQGVIAAAVSKDLGEPQSAAYVEESFYQRADMGLVVCGQVQSANRMGQPVSNFYVLGLSPERELESCELLSHDPRLRR